MRFLKTTPVCRVNGVLTSPGQREYVVTPVPSNFLASSFANKLFAYLELLYGKEF